MLDPLEGDNPCGENLEYSDPDFLALAAAVEEADVNWREAYELATKLCASTKDLRIGVQLARSALVTNGLIAFADVVSAMRTWQTNYWEELHPELEDPADNLPQPRANALAVLTKDEPDPDKVQNSTKNLLRNAPLAQGKLGSVCLRDCQLAASTSSPSDSDADSEEDDATEPVAQQKTLGSITAIFTEESSKEFVLTTHQAVQNLIEDLHQISKDYDDKLGFDAGPNVSDLVKLLKEMLEAMERYGPVSAASSDASDAEGIDGDQGAAGAGSALSVGQITSRQDVSLALENICAYFEQHEPSSPVPIILRRAKKLIAMNFIEVLHELTPEAVENAQHIIGSESE